jgi:hypothetical protein
MLGIAIVNKHSNVVWSVAITIWQEKKNLRKPVKMNNDENLDLGAVVAYVGRRHEDL